MAVDKKIKIVVLTIIPESFGSAAADLDFSRCMIFN